jgi:eukaryotic-like serine/threonine-protein kinase
MRQDALIGRKVAGRFTIKRFLGEGGMAIVYVAEQDVEPHEVALKIMNRELTADRTFVKRFQREAKAASKVQHPSSVQIIDYGVTDGLSYIAMELLGGDDLYVLLEREGAIAQGRAARILIQVCDALMVAHDMGIVHRDLKPENIMVIPDPEHPDREQVKVLDFGIAKLLTVDFDDDPSRDSRAEPASAVTRAGTFIGTPAYMSPEQCSLQSVDTRADIYTCGVLLFQLITGRLPFEGETPLHTATLHIHQAPPRPSTYAPLIDGRLEAVIMKALAKKPADRHQTARHLASTLRKIEPELADMPVAAAGSVRRPTSSYRPRGLSSVVAPPPSSDEGGRMESARTLVAADGQVDSPPPPALLHGEEAPSTPNIDTPTRVRPADAETSHPAAFAVPLPAVPADDQAAGPDDDDDDEFRTLVRAPPPSPRTLVRPLPGSRASLDDPVRFGPQRTEVMELSPVSAPRPQPAPEPQPEPPKPAKRVMKPTLKSADAFRPGGQEAAAVKPKKAAAPVVVIDRNEPEDEPEPPAAPERPPPAKAKSIPPPSVPPVEEITAQMTSNAPDPADASLSPEASPAAPPAAPAALHVKTAQAPVAKAVHAAPAPQNAPVARVVLTETVPMGTQRPHFPDAPPDAPGAAPPQSNEAPLVKPIVVAPPPIAPLAFRVAEPEPDRGARRGMIIGFIAGMVMMALFALVYSILLRHESRGDAGSSSGARPPPSAAP